MLTFRNDGAWSKVGRLGLSDAEENAIVSFMQTLTDGFIPANQP